MLAGGERTCPSGAFIHNVFREGSRKVHRPGTLREDAPSGAICKQGCWMGMLGLLVLE